jgi:predicted transcriptional regulator of viral defense system
MPQYATFGRLATIAEDQWGLVTRRQAEMTGVSRATLQRLASSGALSRVAHGVYHLAGAPTPGHLALKAAWLQLKPEVPAWERTAELGVVSHRSAAALYGLGHLPADQHDFMLPTRRQSRRADVRLHRRVLRPDEWIWLDGMPVTRPGRIAADLLNDDEDTEAVAHVIVDAIRGAHDQADAVAAALGPQATALGLRSGEALLRQLLDVVGDRDTHRWIREARRGLPRAAVQTQPTTVPAHAGKLGA